MLHHLPSGPQQIGNDRDMGNYLGKAGSRAMSLPSCNLLEHLHTYLVPVSNHLEEAPWFLEWFVMSSRLGEV